MATDDEEGAASYMQGLYDRFNKVAVDIQEIHGKIDATNPSTIIIAVAETKAVISKLIELQEYQKGLPSAIGTADIGVSIAREINDLLEQTKALYIQLSSIAGKVSGEDSNSSNNNDSGSSKSREDSALPALTRDDMGKLFLLTSKAYSIKAISLEQRNKIKGEIILQKGYLRDIFLKGTDIAEVLTTMSAFPV